MPTAKAKQTLFILDLFCCPLQEGLDGTIIRIQFEDDDWAAWRALQQRNYRQFLLPAAEEKDRSEECDSFGVQALFCSSALRQ